MNRDVRCIERVSSARHTCTSKLLPSSKCGLPRPPPPANAAPMAWQRGTDLAEAAGPRTGVAAPWVGDARAPWMIEKPCLC